MTLKVHRQNLLAIATAYGRATGQSLGQVSKQFYGSWNWIRGFVDGENTISMDKYYSMIDAFTAAWPPDTPWPALRAAVIHRPKPRRGRSQKRIIPREGSSPLPVSNRIA